MWARRAFQLLLQYWRELLDESDGTDDDGAEAEGRGCVPCDAVAMSVLMAGRVWAGQAAACNGCSTESAASTDRDGCSAMRCVANAGPEQGVVLDRVVAVVNGDVILESDVDEERRFEEVQPYRSGPDVHAGQDH